MTDLTQIDADAPLGASPPPPSPFTPRLLDSAWRALAYCLHPRVIWLSLLPLVLAAVSLLGLAWWGWGDANEALRQALDNWSISQALLSWLDAMGLQGMRSVLVPMLLLLLVVPLVVVVCLLLVAVLITPAVVRLVRLRRFPALASKHREPAWRAAAWSIGATALALGALLLTLPLWFVPLFALVGPPLIWGWLTYRVMAYDTLADLATPQERQDLMRAHRTPLLLMGVVCGYLGAAPAALWAMGVLAIALAPFVLVASVWLYTLVFVFSSLWFAHYLLAALAASRAAPHSTPRTPT
ncbi:MAG: EI24 domain-containing protein [Burkholderiales bacterium]|nr:EI24 domain-containing protein [Burkholderiales bacterium]MBH2016274.1 EI24 domain-containing protein [Burkholderiales bacterium]